MLNSEVERVVGMPIDVIARSSVVVIMCQFILLTTLTLVLATLISNIHTQIVSYKRRNIQNNVQA